jgi:hypothetical protein
MVRKCTRYLAIKVHLRHEIEILPCVRFLPLDSRVHVALAAPTGNTFQAISRMEAGAHSTPTECDQSHSNVKRTTIIVVSCWDQTRNTSTLAAMFKTLPIHSFGSELDGRSPSGGGGGGWVIPFYYQNQNTFWGYQLALTDHFSARHRCPLTGLSHPKSSLDLEEAALSTPRAVSA